MQTSQTNLGGANVLAIPKKKNGRPFLNGPAHFQNGPEGGLQGAAHESAPDSAVVRRLQMGQRVIPDGPRVEQFAEHRRWLAEHDPECGIVSTTEAYDEYADMCILGGWRPVGKHAFLSRLAAIGYVPRRLTTGTGERPRMFDFNQPPNG